MDADTEPTRGTLEDSAIISNNRARNSQRAEGPADCSCRAMQGKDTRVLPASTTQKTFLAYPTPAQIRNYDLAKNGGNHVVFWPRMLSFLTASEPRLRTQSQRKGSVSL